MTYAPEDVDALVRRASDALADYKNPAIDGMTAYTAHMLDLALVPFRPVVKEPDAFTSNPRSTY